MGLQFKWFTRLEPLHDPSRQLKKHVRCPLGVLHGRGLFVWRNLCSTMLNVRICADLYSCIGYLWTLPRCIMDEHKLSNCVAPESAWNPPTQHVSIFLTQMMQLRIGSCCGCISFSANLSHEIWIKSRWIKKQSIQPRQTCFHWRWYLNKIRFHKISMHLGSQHVSSCLWQMKAWKLRVVLGSSWVVKYRTT